MNRVEPGSFLTLHYRLRSADGAPFIDTFDAQPATLSLGTGELAPAMESRLFGLAAGDEASFELAAAEAFGERSGELVQRLNRSALASFAAADEAYSVGEVVAFPAPQGQGSFSGVVRAVDGDSIVFDFNHPLAGRPVRFDVRVVAVL